MKSKERINIILDHKEADKVPVGEWGVDHHITEKILGRKTYWRNRKEQTLALWEGRRNEVVESWKKDLVELVNRLDHDLVPVVFCPSKNERVASIRKIADDTWEDEYGNVYKYTAGNDSIMCVKMSKKKQEIYSQLRKPLIILKMSTYQVQELKSLIKKKRNIHLSLLMKADLSLQDIL